MLDRNSEKVIMAEKYAQIYEVTYDEDLHILDKSQPIGVSFIAKHSKNIYEYAKFLPLDESGTMVELVGSRTLKNSAPYMMKTATSSMMRTAIL